MRGVKRSREITYEESNNNTIENIRRKRPRRRTHTSYVKYGKTDNNDYENEIVNENNKIVLLVSSGLVENDKGPDIGTHLIFRSLDSLLSSFNIDPSNDDDDGEKEKEKCESFVDDTDYDNFVPEIIDLKKIETLDDLIYLGKNYHPTIQRTYRELDLMKLKMMIPALNELKYMIGLENVKSDIVNQVLFSLQGYNVNDDNKNSEMMHTIITGPPGVGKTTLARIIGKIYTALGLLSKGTFREVSRSDLIAKYLGQTAIKTQKAIDDCAGGVMFIDEAYALGHSEGRDSFSKECLDTLNKNLSDKRDFLCIIAGYKKDLDKCFFNMNEGLKRRFSFRYDINKYDYNELYEIFKSKVANTGWTFNFENCDYKFIKKPDKEEIIDNYRLNELENNLEDDDLDDVAESKSDNEIYLESDEYKKYLERLDEIKKTRFNENELVKLFRKNRELFPFSGGDVETLFLKCKIINSRKLPTIKKVFDLEDIQEGFKIFMRDRKSTDSKKKTNNTVHSMYVH